ncbi:glycoside hydrolase family 6 protein [Nocardioides sp.]|uniref:glycoside hydrolase family 6 protein n=1 Tax=Nocardioides sp. TaxID=35761 RepID=UPI00286CBBCD|nr:glycoside hydrolase family 6 protein [Nocardioides sp.]
MTSPPTLVPAVRSRAVWATALSLAGALLVAGSPSSATPAPERLTPTLAAVGATTTAATSTTVEPRRAGDPRRTRGLFVDPLMKAAQAGSEFDRIGKRAQPLWITDFYTSATVEADVRRYVARAQEAKKTPLLAIYNIPDRDCGLYSSQDEQITDAYYRSWVTKAAAGLKGSKAIVILEPDALPFIDNPQCTGRGDRVGLMRFATKVLTRAGAWVYIDAGHSGWQPPDHMAVLLKRAGIGMARGFSSNVANSRTTPDEVVYTRAILAELKKRGVSGVKYVIDTGRNGAGRNGPENGDVCNPLAARLGATPRLVFKGAFDGRLWVKNPGESDGPCNGGPASGEWWPDGARRLMGTLD